MSSSHNLVHRLSFFSFKAFYRFLTILRRVSIFQKSNAAPAANNAPTIFPASTPPASFAKAGGVVVGVGPVRPVLFVKIGGTVGRTQVQVMLVEQGTGPSVSVHVTVWPLSKGLAKVEDKAEYSTVTSCLVRARSESNDTGRGDCRSL
jgi:hypothetical protein